ncbi:uncharacterized protein LOC128657752 [Bombina bombina]|uniref:uncharacterized protein LOC128657752 n=1 Tax=Bombina bombina TaxID=8345 RepID=UPI00235A6992|nr:uncharacterized protein LOC128657752 [Bombina bombina]
MECGGSSELYSMWAFGSSATQAGFYCEQTKHEWVDEGHLNSTKTDCPCWLLGLSDEVLMLVLELLDPIALLMAGGTCTKLYGICSTDSLWAKHCRVTFGSAFRNNCMDYTPKEAYKLLFVWGKLYKTLPYNRQLQDLLFSGIPPQKYWVQWLALEEMIPLPPIHLSAKEIEEIWGIKKELLDEKHKESDHPSFKYEWRELHNLALQYHGEYSKIQSHVLQKMSSESHSELEWLYCQYQKFRFQWLFSYWLFGLSKSCARQLQRIYLWWKRHNKSKVPCWGARNCDVKYLASLHYITSDYWNGKLANGDENIGIQTVENYFSMCKSLLAWILGRKWGRHKQKKVYTDTLDGVYRMLKAEMHISLITHEQFWMAAKVQMLRVCRLESTAGNYVNWRLIDSLPCYRLYMMTGDQFYLKQINSFLIRKQLIKNWVYQEENLWVRNLLPDGVFQLLEYDTKIFEEWLHGDTAAAQISRLIWLYLHSGQQLYMEALKGLVYECAYMNYVSQIFESSNIVLSF